MCSSDLETIRLQQERIDLESKAAEFKKYTQIWVQLPELKKKVEGIKSDAVNKIVSDLAKKYSINKIDMKISLPNPLEQGIFKRSTIDVLHTKINLDFLSATDATSISFIDDFLNSLAGHKIITQLEISRENEYTRNDLQKISTGKYEGNIKTKAIINWYAYKNK